MWENCNIQKSTLEAVVLVFCISIYIQRIYSYSYFLARFVSFFDIRLFDDIQSGGDSSAADSASAAISLHYELVGGVGQQ